MVFGVMMKISTFFLAVHAFRLNVDVSASFIFGCNSIADQLNAGGRGSGVGCPKFGSYLRTRSIASHWIAAVICRIIIERI